MAKPTIGEIVELRDAARAAKTESEGVLAQLKAASTKYEGALAAMDELVAKAKADQAGISGALEQSESLQQEIAEFKETAEESVEKITAFGVRVDGITKALDKEEFRLKQLMADAETLRKTVEGLLPGATSAGLASAYKDRKESFQKPARNWSIAFIASIVLLLAIAFVNPISLRIDQVTPENFYLYVLMRLPFLVPVVWLAIYAAHRHNQALRLEEEYAHKEAISKSFEGYKNQLLEIEADTNSSAAEHLVNRTLEALGRHPGRIYDAKREDVSPLSSVTEAASKLFKFGKNESSEQAKNPGE